MNTQINPLTICAVKLTERNNKPKSNNKHLETMKKIMLVCAAMIAFAAMTACKSGVNPEESIEANGVNPEETIEANNEDTTIKCSVGTEDSSIATTIDEELDKLLDELLEHAFDGDDEIIIYPVSGVVADSKTHKGIAGAEVAGMADAEVAVSERVNRCKEDGKFLLYLKEGKQQISIKTAGYDTILNITINAKDSRIDLDTIFLRGK